MRSSRPKPRLIVEFETPQPDWTGSEPCRNGKDPDAWFPDKGHSAAALRAKRACQDCPVLPQCRDWALANPTMTTDGVWGGMTPTERRRARRISQPTPVKESSGRDRERGP